MDINLQKIKIKDIFNGYIDNDEEGVYGYGGKLNIRPKYQREFSYDEEQQKAVIDTILKEFPLNVMYWSVNPDGCYELLDGQQRTLSFCKFLSSAFSIKNNNGKDIYFHTLPEDIKEKFLNYECLVYICKGKESEKLDWFRVINIAGLKLTEQELRNAFCTGSWLTSAKKYFSKIGCPASRISDSYISAEINRQGLLEIALKFIAIAQNTTIDEYMSRNQDKEDATELWEYFSNVINWIEFNFTDKYSQMKSVNWGELYYKYKDIKLSPEKTSIKIKELMKDKEVQKKSGIYEYILSGKEKFLNLRDFDIDEKRTQYEIQEGVCPMCKKHFEFEEMQGDHKIAWSKGGKTTPDNLQMLCRDCNLEKSAK